MKDTPNKKHKSPIGSMPPFQHSSDFTLTCQRCQGLLIREFCMDIHDGTGENGFWGLRCLQCGELLDPLILKHRISKTQTVLTGRSRQRSPVALS